MARWTPARVTTLTELWERGHPACDIATALNTTAAAVIGKAGAIHLPARPRQSHWAGREGELARLWRAGISVRLIAAEFGVTSNAVIGKAYRLGLPTHPSLSQRKRAA